MKKPIRRISIRSRVLEAQGIQCITVSAVPLGRGYLWIKGIHRPDQKKCVEALLQLMRPSPTKPLSPPYFIYALIDPRTSEIRYVGVTQHPQYRFQEHLTSAAHDTPRDAREAWLRELRLAGLKPYLRILEKAPPGEANIRETWWIRYLAERGMLTNWQYARRISSRPAP